MPLLAYFLTWTTYGTRLHGDQRGSIDAAHNTPGTDILLPDPSREARVGLALCVLPMLVSGVLAQLGLAAVCVVGGVGLGRVFEGGGVA